MAGETTTSYLLFRPPLKGVVKENERKIYLRRRRRRKSSCEWWMVVGRNTETRIYVPIPYVYVDIQGVSASADVRIPVVVVVIWSRTWASIYLSVHGLKLPLKSGKSVSFKVIRFIQSISTISLAKQAFQHSSLTWELYLDDGQRKINFISGRRERELKELI